MNRLPLPARRLWALRFCLVSISALVLCTVVAGALPLRGRRPLVVGYFPQWGIYNAPAYYVKTLMMNGGAARLDQINYSQGAVHDGHCSLADPNADLNSVYTSQTAVNGVPDNPASPFRGNFHQLEELKHRYPHIKILISLEGRASDFAADAKPENRRAFVTSCVDTFLRGHFAAGVHEPGVFDGFDIDWESPQEAEAGNFRALLEEFRAQMKSVGPGLRLSVAVGESPQMLPGTDFAAIAQLVDQIGVMNYDYAGPWNTTTGFLAPLFASFPGMSRQGSIESSIASYKAAGVPPEKLLMGVPFYGYSWTVADRSNNGLFQKGHGVHGDQPYRYIRTLRAPFTAYRDGRSQAPWLFDGQTFWTYEDPTSVRYKVSYARRQRLGGVMIWELSGDSADAELLNTAYRALHHPLKPKVFNQARSASSAEERPATSSSEELESTAPAGMSK